MCTMRCIFILILSCALPGLVLADQITLKNGDRLTGKVVKSDGKTVILHTDAAGDVEIKFDAVDRIVSDEQLHVGLKNGKTVVGTVTGGEQKLEVSTRSSGTVEAATSDVTTIRNDDEQKSFDQKQHPGLLHGWNGGLDLGFSVARGNSEVKSLSLAFNAAHASVNDKFTVYWNTLDTTNDLTTPSTVANLVQAGLRYEHNLNARTFAFVGGDLMSNALQDLDLRQIYGGGLGYHAIKNDATQLDFLGGVNYTHETYSNGPEVLPPTAPPVFESYGLTRRFVALTLGETLTHKAGKSTLINESFTFYPDLQDTSEYQGVFSLGTVTKLNKWLGWQNQFGDIYVSDPPVGTKKNDLVFTTGLNVSFTH